MKETARLQSIHFLSLFILGMLVNILAQAVHETGHRMALMGREPVWAFTKLVQLWETTPVQPDQWVKITNSDGTTSWLKIGSWPIGNFEKAAASAAGPLAGLFSAGLGLSLSRRSTKVTAKQAWLAYTISISLVAVLYYLRAPMRTLGDEYDIAVNLGTAKSFVEIPLALGYLACLVLGLRELPAWRIRFAWLGTILLGTIATGLPMAMLDPIIIAQVDAGNPWFQPVIGYSLPVFLTTILAFLGTWAWARWQEGASK